MDSEIQNQESKMDLENEVKVEQNDNIVEEKEQTQNGEEHITIIFNKFKDIVKQGDIEGVKTYIEKYQQKHDLLNRVDPLTKQTILFLTLLQDQQKSIQLVKLMLDNGADINYLDSLRQGIIFYICREGRLQMLELLKDYNVQFDNADNFGQTPLYYASREGNIQVVKFLIQHGANVNHTDNISNQTALFYAAREGHAEVVKYLIEQGCNFAHTDTKKQSALNWAKKYNRTQVVELLQMYNNQLKQNKNQKVQQVAPVVVQETKVEKAEKKRSRPEETKIPYKLVFTDDHGKSTDLTLEDFEKFKAQYPDIADLLINADVLISKEMLEKSKDSDNWEKTSKKILSHLFKMKGAYLFHVPVDPIKLGVKDYFEIIKSPMDFGTIKNKLNNNVYKECKDFVDDMNLVFSNSILYNGLESEVGKITQNIQKEFENLSKIHNLFEEKQE